MNLTLPSRTASWVFAALLLAAALGLYLPALNNALLFDDIPLLVNRQIFSNYGSLLDFKQRMLSYSSFVWLEWLTGENWPAQRAVNLALHLAVAWALYALLARLFALTDFPEDMTTQPRFAASRRAALHVGVAFFTLHPVAVYAVGYLIQRSILMATLFSLLACLAWLQALTASGKQRGLWSGTALLCYVLAMLCKEHAVMTAALALPLYIHVRRPPFQRIAALGGVALLLLACVTVPLLQIYGGLIGQVFDNQSRSYVEQLEGLQPGINEKMYPLSLMNQAALFWGYGLRWLLPLPQWLSIDLRPAFPLGFASWQLIGAVAWLAVFAASLWLLLCRKGVASLIGVLLLLPLLWFCSEFSTVWVQDPFVLYRSYLWAAPLAGLLALPLVGLPPRVIYSVGMVLAVVLGGLAFERHMSLKNELTAWTDAADKIDLQAPANALGRSRPFANLGKYYIGQNLYHQAERSLTTGLAVADLGELSTVLHFNFALVQQAKGQHRSALEHFTIAAKTGYDDYPLRYQRAQTLAALGQLPAAWEDSHTAVEQLERSPDNNPAMQQRLRVQRAEFAIALKKYDEAAADFIWLLQNNPTEARFAQGLGMAFVGSNHVVEALQMFNQLIQDPHAPKAAAHYGRSLAYSKLGQKAAAVQDIETALQLEPRNPLYQRVRTAIMADGKP